MSLGCPVVFSEVAGQPRRFQSLDAITTLRDDPHSFDEGLLQELIGATPDIIPIREYLPSTTALFSLGREVPLDLGGSQGRIDNLLVTNDGYLVIVETKLYRNPEGIREVVTQTLQYGMAVGQLSIRELEGRIKVGQFPALLREEGIRESVARLAAPQGKSALLADDFEEALERHLRRGEVLLLIVSDGIHVGVERVTSWLNKDGNSTPFKFGMVELKIYTNGSERVVVPRTVLKTREISRHVVVVDIQPKIDVDAVARVTDDFKNDAGGSVQESRSVKAATPPMTKNHLLQMLASDERQAATRVLERLEAFPFDLRGTASYLQAGFYFPADGGDFHPLVNLGNGGIWAYPLVALRKAMGPEQMIAFHHGLNQFGAFYRDDQLDDPDSAGCVLKYQQLNDTADGLAAYLDAFRTQAISRLEASVAA